ncbi:hypothetical protein [Pseudomonas allokribbensis]|uniref:hypothetical protein n=1 Tax=Pseudomonas allokribbensis TaxID=2774460 RepID=UPI0017879C68|nr:hypothetical protein [Pseudomonas allokribbensis]
MPSQQNHFTNRAFRSVRTLLVASSMLLGSGCAMLSNTFTLKTEMPAQFNVYTTAYYSELFGGICILPDDYAGDPQPDRKEFYADAHATPFTSEFEIAVSRKVGDCFLVLSGIDFNIGGHSATDEKTIDTSSVGLKVETFLGENEKPATRIDEQILAVRCHWQDPSSDRSLKSSLQCRGLDANGNERKGPELGMLKNRQLQGLTLRLKVSVDDEPRNPGS